MSARDDRGLEAVRRVREARERDSRVGLQHALTSAEQHEEEAVIAQQRVASVTDFSAGTVTEFRSHAFRGRALAENAAEKHEQARRSATIAAEARRRWARDRQQLRMVQLLLERRAEERRTERARREGAELDDLATQAWLRNRPTPTEELES
jgi:flagellar biosynthesis chaperone FliJ